MRRKGMVVVMERMSVRQRRNSGRNGICLHTANAGHQKGDAVHPHTDASVPHASEVVSEAAAVAVLDSAGDRPYMPAGVVAWVPIAWLTNCRKSLVHLPTENVQTMAAAMEVVEEVLVPTVTMTVLHVVAIADLVDSEVTMQDHRVVLEVNDLQIWTMVTERGMLLALTLTIHHVIPVDEVVVAMVHSVVGDVVGRHTTRCY
jgi:hypothetical protein